MNGMEERLKKFENKQPEIIFEWKDSETEAEGWVVINSLRGGAAGGGTRMRLGLDKKEVISLAKTMEIKFTISNPAIGGAKSGINFNPNDSRKHGVLKRWYKAITPLLKEYYGTGGDLNVDEIHEVIPITQDCGVLHPQEGVLVGHFNPSESEKIKKIKQLREGICLQVRDKYYSPDIQKKYSISDLITGYGVSASVKHFYDIWGGTIEDKKFIIQGWGNVGSAAAYYATIFGGKVVGIIDISGGLINENGFSIDEITKLYCNKKGNKLYAENLMNFKDINYNIWDIKADVFLPCAASRIITKLQVNRIIKAGVNVISSGANVPFADQEIFFGPIGKLVDQKITLIPDFISNCGMARVFSYLMQDNIEINDRAIFEDTSETIKNTLYSIHQINSNKTQIAKTSFEISLNNLNIY